MDMVLESVKRGDTPATTPKSQSRVSIKHGEEIDISSLELNTREEAMEIALIVLQVLEEDLYEANQQGRFGRRIQRHLSNPDLERERRRKWIRDHESVQSITSDLSLIDLKLHAPSTMDLYYRKGANPRQFQPLKSLPKSSRSEKSTQVSLHRSPHEGAKVKAAGTQTLETLGMRGTKARLEFMKMYPAPDHWTYNGISSRNPSLAEIARKLEENQMEEHAIPVGPKPMYRKANRERILQPINGEFQKAEAYWTGSTFKGDFKDRSFSEGLYNYPTWATYESEFKDGHIHSTKHFGLVTFPRGDTFEGTWNKGRFIGGQITFADGLKFEPIGWKYCTPPDRRFFIELSHGVHGIGETYYSDHFPPPHIPYGCYDVGDGVYYPETGKVISYKGVFLRKATEYEHRWILANCRKRKPLSECYEPCFMDERLPDAYAHRIPKNT